MSSKQSNHVSTVVQQGSALLPMVASLQALYTEALVLGYISRDETGAITCNLPEDAFAGDNAHLDADKLAAGYAGLAALNDAIVANNGALLAKILLLKR
jgi:hypothetical protein